VGVKGWNAPATKLVRPRPDSPGNEQAKETGGKVMERPGKGPPWGGATVVDKRSRFGEALHRTGGHLN